MATKKQHRFSSRGHRSYEDYKNRQVLEVDKWRTWLGLVGVQYEKLSTPPLDFEERMQKRIEFLELLIQEAKKEYKTVLNSIPDDKVEKRIKQKSLFEAEIEGYKDQIRDVEDFIENLK